MTDEWVVCVTAPDLAIAQVIRSQLEANDIPVMIPDEATAGVAWHLSQAMGGIRILVPAEHLEAAAELLAGGEALEPAEAEAPEATSLSSLGDEDRQDRSAGDQLAHRAFKTAVVGTLLFIVLPYALSLVLQALSQGGLSHWGKVRLTLATAISLVWLAGFFVILRLLLAPIPVAP